MPSRYQVLMHASGFSADVGTGKPVIGFYTARRVIADTEYKACRRAKEILWKEPRILELLEATRENLGSNDSCKVEVETCFEINWWDWMFKKYPGGLIFYSEEGEYGSEDVTYSVLPSR